MLVGLANCAIGLSISSFAIMVKFELPLEEPPLETVEYELEADYSSRGCTHLMKLVVMANEHPESHDHMVKLLEAGADPNKECKSRLTAMYIALMKVATSTNAMKSVNILAKYGAVVPSIDPSCDTINQRNILAELILYVPSTGESRIARAIAFILENVASPTAYIFHNTTCKPIFDIAVEVTSLCGNYSYLEILLRYAKYTINIAKCIHYRAAYNTGYKYKLPKIASRYLASENNVSIICDLIDYLQKNCTIIADQSINNILTSVEPVIIKKVLSIPTIEINAYECLFHMNKYISNAVIAEITEILLNYRDTRTRINDGSHGFYPIEYSIMERLFPMTMILLDNGADITRYRVHHPAVSVVKSGRDQLKLFKFILDTVGLTTEASRSILKEISLISITGENLIILNLVTDYHNMTEYQRGQT